MRRDQFSVGIHCVTVSFRGTGLDVDVVPVLYEGDEDDRGYLLRVNRRDSGAVDYSKKSAALSPVMTAVAFVPRSRF